MTPVALALSCLLAASGGEGSPPGGAAVAIPAPSPSPDPDSRLRLRLRAGGYWVAAGRRSSLVEGDRLDVEASLAVDLSRHVALEAGVGWYQLYLFALGVIGPVDAVPVTASLRVSTAGGADRASLSILAGAGAHVFVADTSVSAAGGWTPHRATDVGPAAHLGAALAVPVSRRFRVGVEARQSWSRLELLGVERAISGRHLGLMLELRT